MLIDIKSSEIDEEKAKIIDQLTHAFKELDKVLQKLAYDIHSTDEAVQRGAVYVSGKLLSQVNTIFVDIYDELPADAQFIEEENEVVAN